MESERTPVQVGIDLRPLPLRLDAETVFHFNPDPDKEFFSETQRLGKEMSDESNEGMWDAIDRMRDTLASQIVDENERKLFMDKKYGMAVLGAIASTYAEQVVALPTESSSPSGRGQQRRGGSR